MKGGSIVGNLAAAAQAAAAGMSATTPTVASVQAQGQAAVQGTFNFPIERWVHIVLTGVFPMLMLIPYVGPFIFSIPYMWGVNGMNILVATSGSDTAWTAAKIGVYYACKVLSEYLDVEFGDQWWEPIIRYVLLYANPWFVFDIVQASPWNPNFEKEGYKIPFWGKLLNSKLGPGAKTHPSSAKDFGWKYVDSKGHPVLDAKGVQQVSYGWMGPLSIGACIALIIPSLYSILGSIPAAASTGYKSVLDAIMLVVGGLAAVTSGGLGAVVVLPALKDKLVSYLNPATVAPAALAPVAVPAAVPTAAPVAARGGGYAQPTVQDVAESLLRKAVQKGGGADADTSDYLFMGILSFIFVGGVSLAAVRSKLRPGSIVE